MIKARQYKPFRVFVRQVFNGFMTLLLAYMSGLPQDQYVYLPLVYASLNYVTKYVNTRYFGDLGVL